MAMGISCSFCLLPRAPDSNSSATTRATRLSVNENRGSWRSRCALGLAGLILAIEFGNFIVAGETQALESPPELLVGSRRLKIFRWSDKRKCAPWRANSLEIIVPENLPRPSHRRNWEMVTYMENAPAVQVISSKTKSSSKYCFSL